MKKVLLFTFCLSSIVMLFSFKCIFQKKTSGKEVVQKLESLGYFKYVHSSKVAELKNALAEGYATHGALVTTYEMPKCQPSDYRLYGLDGETLYEEGGFRSYLSDMERTFKKLKVNLKIENKIEEYTQSGGLNHIIWVNGKKNGRIAEWFESGIQNTEGSFKDEKQHGIWVFRMPDNKTVAIVRFNEGVEEASGYFPWSEKELSVSLGQNLK
ncbi:toxin-antitoxin system YwqK family antitoxin [Pontibacter pamirensis]|uniref:hypothetical protein n=1 Tax=Pontibacter pamirensis TaxID=2562824 RepID=UPI001389B4A7|nr:hypothetical protein [Pontibacter pamirensis]